MFFKTVLALQMVCDTVQRFPNIRSFSRTFRSHYAPIVGLT